MFGQIVPSVSWGKLWFLEDEILNTERQVIVRRQLKKDSGVASISVNWFRQSYTLGLLMDIE